MHKNQSSLWKPNEEIKEKSNLKKFCKHLNAKGYIKDNVNFKNIWEWSVKKKNARGSGTHFVSLRAIVQLDCRLRAVHLVSGVLLKWD